MQESKIIINLDCPKSQWKNSIKTIIDVQNFLLRVDDVEFVFQEIESLYLKDENDISQLKNILLKHLETLLTNSEGQIEKKQTFKKKVDNLVISSEIILRGKLNVSLFHDIMKANLLYKLEMLLNNNHQDAFLLIDERFHEYYLDLIEILIFKADFQSIKYLLPCKKKMEILRNKGFIPIVKEMVFIFEEDGKRKVNNTGLKDNKFEYNTINYIINLLIYLDSNNFKEEEMKSVLNQHTYNEKNVYILEHILTIYRIIKNSLRNKLSFKQFLNMDVALLIDSENIHDLIKNDEKYVNFCNDFCLISKKIRENLNYCEKYFESEFLSDNDLKLFFKKVKRITQLPIIVLEEIINGKVSIVSKNIFIKQFITITEMNTNVVFKQLITFLIENLASSSNIKMTIDILEKNSECFKNFNVLKDLINLRELIDICNNYGIKANPLDILKTDIAIKSRTVDFYKSPHYEILSGCLTKMIKERKTEIYSKLLDNNKSIVDVFSNFLAKYNIRFNDFLINYLTSNRLYKCIPQILMNDYYKLWKNATSIDLNNFFAILFNNKEGIKEMDMDEMIKETSTFLIGFNDIDTSIQIKIKNFIKYMKVFSQNTLEVDLLKDYTVDNTNFLEIIEIYILKKFTIDEIISINDFLTKCNDLFEALSYNNEEFLFNLFLVFSKYGNVKICSEIIMKLRNSVIFLEKCHSHIMKVSNKNFANELLSNTSISLSLIEKLDNTKMIINNINLIDFTNFKYKSQDFEIENLDVIALYDFHEKVKKTKEDLKSVIYQKCFSLPNIVKYFEFFDKNNVTNNKCEDPIIIDSKEIIRKGLFDFVHNFKENSASFTSKLLSSRTNKSSSVNEGLNKFLSEAKIKIDFQVLMKNPLYKYKIYKNLLTSNRIDVSMILNLEGINLENIIVDDEKFVDVLILFSLIFTVKSLDKFEKLIIILKDKLKIIQNPNSIIDILIGNLLKKTQSFTFQHYSLINLLFPTYLKYTDELLKLNSCSDLDFLFSKINESTKGKFSMISFIDYSRDLEEELNTFTKEFEINLFSKKSDRKIQQKIEIFKRVTVNNLLVFKTIFKLLGVHNDNEYDIDFIFLLKILSYTINFSCIEGILSSDINDIFNFIHSRKFSQDNMKHLFIVILSMNTVKYIFESYENITIFNNTIIGTVNKIIGFRVKLFEELKSHFNDFLDNNPIYYEKFRILKAKKYTLDHSPEDTFQTLYETLINSESFDDLIQAIKEVDELNNKAFLDNVKKIYLA